MTGPPLATPRAEVRRFAVVGSPVSHSLSPVLHRAAYRELGVDDAAYARHEVPAGELDAFLADGPGRELQGLSVTMPGKPEAHAVAAEHDGTSLRLGIANTLLRRPDGGWRAENHDVHGIVAALRPLLDGGPTTGAVLGSGATALSATAALAELGVDRLLLSARRPEALAPLRELAEASGIAVAEVPWERSAELLDAEAVVSALAAEGAAAVAERWGGQGPLPRPGAFLDVLYEPWPAPLAALVTATGAPVADGLQMLAHQADMQVRSMLGVPEAPVEAMLAAARAELASR